MFIFMCVCMCCGVAWRGVAWRGVAWHGVCVCVCVCVCVYVFEYMVTTYDLHMNTHLLTADMVLFEDVLG